MIKIIILILAFSQACGPVEPGVSENSDPCWSAPVSECKKNGCGEILGAPFSVTKTCFEESLVVGCFPKDRTHENATIFAEDLSGTCWRFSNTTIPPGWISEFDEQWKHPKGKHPSGCQSAKTCEAGN